MLSNNFLFYWGDEYKFIFKNKKISHFGEILFYNF